MFKRSLLFPVLALLTFSELQAQEAPTIEVIPRYEAGFLAILFHDYQSGSDGTRFDYLKQGSQDTLFPTQRITLEGVVAGQHRISLVYQPLTLKTKTVADRNNTNGGDPVVIDGVSFTPGTPMDLTYGFDFWRGSYLYDFAPEPDFILGAGLSLQIRNASIIFETTDDAATGNAQRTIQQNIGPVPILKFRVGKTFSPLFGLDFEVDGFYASSAFFNGSGRPFKGWIWDGALTASTSFLPQSLAFVSLRSIGGGAEGTNAYSYVSSSTSSGDFTWNNLGTLSLTLGFTVTK